VGRSESCFPPQLILVRGGAGLRLMTLSMILNVDHFTPLSRAVASIDRDSYAARFAVYDREHKALLRRLATADSPCSDADIAREERAFREAIRRIEFADEDDGPPLVPQHEPAVVVRSEPRSGPRPEPRSELRSEPRSELRPEPRPELRSEPRPEPVWPQPRPPRRETLDDVPTSPSLDQFESEIEPVLRLSEPRSVVRRVGERLVLAVLLLALAGVWIWMSPARREEAATPAALRGAVEPTEVAAPDTPSDAKSQQPTWLSPQIFYAPPAMPSPASSSAPRADVPLPMPRPDR
jgi:hypothetical protein